MKFLFQAALKQRNITEIFHLGDCVIIQMINAINYILKNYKYIHLVTDL